MNSTVDYNIVNTWGYGDMRYPKKLKGMMGHLARKEIDIAGTILFITPDRLPSIDYLSCPIEVKLAFVLRDPPLTYVKNIYYLPFTGVCIAYHSCPIGAKLMFIFQDPPLIYISGCVAMCYEFGHIEYNYNLYNISVFKSEEERKSKITAIRFHVVCNQCRVSNGKPIQSKRTI